MCDVKVFRGENWYLVNDIMRDEKYFLTHHNISCDLIKSGVLTLDVNIKLFESSRRPSYYVNEFGKQLLLEYLEERFVNVYRKISLKPFISKNEAYYHGYQDGQNALLDYERTVKLIYQQQKEREEVMSNQCFSHYERGMILHAPNPCVTVIEEPGQELKPDDVGDYFCEDCDDEQYQSSDVEYDYGECNTQDIFEMCEHEEDEHECKCGGNCKCEKSPATKVVDDLEELYRKLMQTTHDYHELLKSNI